MERAAIAWVAVRWSQRFVSLLTLGEQTIRPAVPRAGSLLRGGLKRADAEARERQAGREQGRVPGTRTGGRSASPVAGIGVAAPGNAHDARARGCRAWSGGALVREQRPEVGATAWEPSSLLVAGLQVCCPGP